MLACTVSLLEEVTVKHNSLSLDDAFLSPNRGKSPRSTFLTVMFHFSATYSSTLYIM